MGNMVYSLIWVMQDLYHQRFGFQVLGVWGLWGFGVLGVLGVWGFWGLGV